MSLAELTDNPKLLLKRVNLGCGFDIRPDYLNVDLNDFHSPDLVADISDLSVLKSGFYDEVLAQDVLEHMTRAVAKNAFGEWTRLLSDSGVMKVRVPSMIGLLGLLHTHPWTVESHELIVQLMFGTQAYNGDFHMAGFTPPIILDWAKTYGVMLTHAAGRDGWLYDLEFVKLRYPQNEEFIHAAYFEILGRPVDESGFAAFSKALTSGKLSRDAFITTLRESDEGKRLPR
jgi:hypothetical protein